MTTDEGKSHRRLAKKRSAQKGHVTAFQRPDKLASEAEETRRAYLAEIESLNIQEFRARSTMEHFDDEDVFVAVCRKIFREWRDCTTPAEEFLMDVIVRYGRFQPTPRSMLTKFQEFQSNHADVINTAKRMLRDYPEAFAEEGNQDQAA